MADSDTDDTITPRKPSNFRIAQLRDFLPLSHDLPTTHSPRHPPPPGLPSVRSNTSLVGLSRTRWNRSNSIGLAPNERAERPDSQDSDEHPELERWGSHVPLSQQVSHNSVWPLYDDHERRMSHAANVLNTPEMRSQRLIGATNPRYRWEQYWTPEEDLKKLKRPLREYYERNNLLIQNYRYIDDLLDSSLPHDLIREYNTQVAQSKGYGATQFREEPDVPDTISEEDDDEIHPRLYTERHGSFDSIMANGEFWANGDPPPPMNTKVKRTPKDIYRRKKDDAGSDERQPLLQDSVTDNIQFGTTNDADVESGSSQMPPDLEIEDEADSNSPIVTRAIYINTAANLILLILKLIVVLMSSSVSVLASLVDAALDFLSTAIVGVTTWMIMRTDQYAYPIGRRRLEPVGVLVFSVIMITAFLQVFYQALTKLSSGDKEVVQLGPSAIGIMASTVVVKGLCWVYCRLIRNSSVQALAQDAMTDVVFNTFSIIFPLVGYALNLSFLDPLGGVILSLYVIVNWSHTANEHICNLAGQAATADQRNILLYLTMRFAKTIKHIQGLQAYHVGDKLNVEVDIVLDERTSLRDSHDLGESLQYVIESVPEVDRAFVHMDYLPYNLPTHMQQHG